jgi:hypothetical protein
LWWSLLLVFMKIQTWAWHALWTHNKLFGFKIAFLFPTFWDPITNVLHKPLGQPFKKKLFGSERKGWNQQNV